MRLLFLLLGALLQCCSSLAQVYFSQPTSEEVIMGGIPFIVTVYESLSVPHFSQMTNLSLLLLSGSNESPMNLYSWYLNDTNPSTVSNSIIFPPSIGPNASNAYFLGIRGSLKLNTSVYATYYSTRFTLMNMTSTQTLDAYTTTSLASILTVLVTCGEPSGASCDPSDLKALSTASQSYVTASTGFGHAAPIVTTPPVGAAYVTSSMIASSSIPSDIIPTAAATTTALGASPMSTIATPTSLSAASTSSFKMLPAMAYPVIIAGLSLTAACVLLYRRYRRNHHHSTTPDCENATLSKTWLDEMPVPSKMRRSRFMKLDAQKASKRIAVELEGERRRENLGSVEKESRFELDSGLENIRKVVDAVSRSERANTRKENVGQNFESKVEEMRVHVEKTSELRKDNVVISTKPVAAKRNLPPLPKDQGKPGCGNEETKDCETKRAAEEQSKINSRYSVGPDGSFNYT